MTTTTKPTRIQDQIERPKWLPTDHWPYALRRYQHHRPHGEALDIHFTDEGSGPTLVFVHAGMWSFIWRDLIAELRDDFRCITLDFPGAGLSEGSRHDVSLADFPAVVSNLLDHCRVEEAVMVVHDLGGVVGVLAAADRPHRITGLVAVNSFAWRPEVRALKIMLRIMGSRTAIGVMGTLRLLPRMTRTKFGVGRNYERWDRRAFFGPYRRRSRSRNFHRAMRSASRSGELFEEAEHALASTLSHLAVLTAFGENNDQFGFADRWKQLFPSARSWTVEGGNHFPMCDEPETFAHQIRRWYAAEVE